MKSERIRLFPFDNFDSVLDKMNQVYQAVSGLERLILEFPKRGRILTDPVEFGRVAGWGRSRGVQVVFMTENAILRGRAEERGIPVLSRRADVGTAIQRRGASAADFKLSARRIADLVHLRQQAEFIREPRASGWLALPLFLIGVWFSGFVFLTVVPHATVVLSPIPSQRSLSFYLWTVEDLSELTTSGGVPSTEVRFHVQASAEAPASGSLSLPPTFAQGTLLLYNRCDSERHVPTGTRFLSEAADDPEFRSLHEASVPTGETREIVVQANTAGRSGNLAPGTVHIVEPPFDRCVIVEQQYPFSGGAESSQPAVSESDYQAVSAELDAALAKAALERVGDFSTETRLALRESLSFVSVYDEDTNPPVGYAGERLTMTRDAIFSIRLIALADIRKQAKMVFMSSPIVGFRSGTDPIAVEIRSIPPDETSDQVYFKVDAIQSGYREIDPLMAADAIRGMGIEAAKNTLRTLYGEAANPEIYLFPAQYRNLPIASVNIQVEIR